MRIAVIGGNGDMGSALIPYLLEQGHAVVSVDRTIPAGPVTFSENLIRTVADMRDFGQMVAVMRGGDAVVHLAAHRSPMNAPDPVVYNENTAGSYNVLSAASALGIKRVCLASSINAIGGVFSRAVRYDYFPVDERHPTYAEDPYSLSKWVLEQQADAFARRFEWMSIASLRLHWLVKDFAQAQEWSAGFEKAVRQHLWAYTDLRDASRACLLSLTADFSGHEVFYIVAPRTVMNRPSLDLARQYFPDVPVRGDLAGQRGFFDCSKAERILGWVHEG
jgi:UDP-glucose 4-epimerase